MKLYYWSELNSLTKCTAGCAFAVAASMHEAIQSICTKYYNDNEASITRHFTHSDWDYAVCVIRNLQNELSTTKPFVTSGVFGAYTVGSS